MKDTPLYVVTAISNPMRWKSRYNLYQEFKQKTLDAGAILYTVELAFGDRSFQVTAPDDPFSVQIRTNDEIWHKENMLNVGINRLPPEAEYIAWIDADVSFTRYDWALETIHELQHYDMVQMFSHAVDLGPNHEPINQFAGFAYYYHMTQPRFDGRPNNMNMPGTFNVGRYGRMGHPGYAWATRRDVLDAVGGLIDYAILGSGDNHMAQACVGTVDHTFYKGIHPNYKNMLTSWQDRFHRYSKRNLGYVRTTLMHGWHGRKQDRGYQTRTNILSTHNYDPVSDVWKDSQGVLRLNPDRHDLRDAIRQYFRSRNEDGIEL